MLFIDDETLLTFLGWGLILLCGWALIAGWQGITFVRGLRFDVSSLSARLREMTDQRLRPGQLVPVRCPIRAASVSVRQELLDQHRPRVGAVLRGWPSENR